MTRRRGRAVPRPQRLEAAAAEHEAGVAVLQREPRPGQQARPRVRGDRHGGRGAEVDGAPGVRPARGLAGPLEVPEVPGLGVADVEDGHQAGVGAGGHRQLTLARCRTHLGYKIEMMVC